MLSTCSDRWSSATRNPQTLRRCPRRWDITQTPSQRSDRARPWGFHMHSGKLHGHLVAEGHAISMPGLANYLSTHHHQPLIVDGSGLKGVYDFSVDYEVDVEKVMDRNVPRCPKRQRAMEDLAKALGLKSNPGVSSPWGMLVIDQILPPDRTRRLVWSKSNGCFPTGRTPKRFLKRSAVVGTLTPRSLRYRGLESAKPWTSVSSITSANATGPEENWGTKTLATRSNTGWSTCGAAASRELCKLEIHREWKDFPVCAERCRRSEAETL